MRSGNGRHRRPRQAPALFVTAGVTGAGIAMPLLGATGAQAADGATWDRVAECESGGLWSANAQNGYYGGLQLTMETWEDYGGPELAARPDLASRGQQIDVAEKILAEEGPEAWPSCGVSSGLALDVELPEAEPLPSEDPTPSDDPAYDSPLGDPTAPGEEPVPDDTPVPDGSAEPTPPPTGPGSGEPSAPSSPPTGTPREDTTESAPVPGDGEGAGRHRGSPDARERPDAERPSRGKDGQDGDYRVRAGDSLSAIADENGIEGGWTAVYERNREVIGSDPDLILPGQRLEL